jgi:phage gpG-like protein
MALRLNLLADGVSLEEIEAELREIRARFGNIRPLLIAVSKIYYESTMERFRSHTDPSGRAWKPLSPKTIEKKKREGSAESPYNQLIFKGKLRAAIKVRHVDANSISIGLRREEIPYAVHHQYGAPNANIPQRKFLGVTQRANREVRKVMEAFVKGQNLGQ